ncbi:MAG: FAD-binding oxidoreductase [Polyangiaceae bacterium]
MPEDLPETGPHGAKAVGLQKVRRAAMLVAARALSPTVRELTLEVAADATGAPFSYEAGQYVDLFVPTKSLTMKRPYSIASAPGERGLNRFDIAVTRAEDGHTSDALHGHGIGDAYEIEGPRGGFVRKSRDRATLFVGAGTGLAPLRAMIQDEVSRSEGPPIALLFGGRDETHLLWRDDAELWRKSGRITVDVSLSRGSESWSGLRGYVQNHVIAAYDQIARVAPEPQVFVCGLSSMVIDVVSALESHGIDPAALFSESYS